MFSATASAYVTATTAASSSLLYYATGLISISTASASHSQKLPNVTDTASSSLLQAWLSSIPTVPSAGLPLEYWNTPLKLLNYSILLVTTSSLAVIIIHLHSSK
jgi:hypothetical protein